MTITNASTSSKTNLNFKSIESTKTISEISPFVGHQPNEKIIVFDVESNQLIRSDLTVASLSADLGTDRFSVSILTFDDEAREKDKIIKNLSKNHPKVLLGSAFNSETIIITTKDSNSWKGHELLFELCKRGGLGIASDLLMYEPKTDAMFVKPLWKERPQIFEENGKLVPHILQIFQSFHSDFEKMLVIVFQNLDHR